MLCDVCTNIFKGNRFSSSETSSRGEVHHTRNHHPNVESLQAAAILGCYICLVVLPKLPAEFLVPDNPNSYITDEKRREHPSSKLGPAVDWLLQYSLSNNERYKGFLSLDVLFSTSWSENILDAWKVHFVLEPILRMAESYCI